MDRIPSAPPTPRAHPSPASPERDATCARRSLALAIRLRRPAWLKRLFAWVTAQSERVSDRLYAERKRGLLAGLHGVVLEIGPGTGANLPYLAPGVRWLGVEPNPFMLGYLHRKAASLRLTAATCVGTAEHLPIADRSVDAVVGTLVLCSVADPARALAEVRRVLRPGGRFVFIEHVAAPAGTLLRRAQECARPLWSVLADGCTPDRETWAAIERAGFATVAYERFAVRVPLVLVTPHIAGQATA
jgi:SAM-dependent methyltransferase